jgi:hypothetical protein
MDIHKTAGEFARTHVTHARMELAYSAVGSKMGVFVKRVVDDVMRDAAVRSDPSFEVAATQAVAAVAAGWFTRRQRISR